MKRSIVFFFCFSLSHFSLSQDLSESLLVSIKQLEDGYREGNKVVVEDMLLYPDSTYISTIYTEDFSFVLSDSVKAIEVSGDTVFSMRNLFIFSRLHFPDIDSFTQAVAEACIKEENIYLADVEEMKLVAWTKIPCLSVSIDSGKTWKHQPVLSKKFLKNIISNPEILNQFLDMSLALRKDKPAPPSAFTGYADTLYYLGIEVISEKIGGYQERIIKNIFPADLIHMDSLVIFTRLKYNSYSRPGFLSFNFIEGKRDLILELDTISSKLKLFVKGEGVKYCIPEHSFHDWYIKISENKDIKAFHTAESTNALNRTYLILNRKNKPWTHFERFTLVR